MRSNSQSQNYFYWLYLIGIFLILALPLLSVPPTFHPASWAKSTVFRIIFSVLIFLFIWETLYRKDRLAIFWQKIRRGPTTLAFWFLVAFLAIFFLATIFSLDPHFSFWGSPYRGGGFLTIGFCIIFAIFLFLIVKEKHWQKILDFTLLIGGLTVIIAIFQKFGLFGKYLVAYVERPMSTMGGPIFFALYLTLLIFLSLAFGLATKGKKKIFYFFSFILLFVGIFLPATRAAFLGLGAGFLFFFFFYPHRSISDKKYFKKIVWLKILAGALLISGILGMFWLKSQPQLAQNFKENKIFGYAFERVWEIAAGEDSIIKYIARSRANGWKVLLEGIKERPILGYGPENLSIAFDKYYDSTLPGIQTGPGGVGGWWDKGHSFIFDISISAGIPALIIYLLLFGTLFWQLQKIKKKNPNKAVISHGLQATFIVYLTTNLFSFDDTVTYLISFLLISYSLHLISSSRAEETLNTRQKNAKRSSDYLKFNPWKSVFIFVLFCVLIWFIWSANLKPLQVNKKINQIVFLLEKVKGLSREDPALAKQQYLKIIEKMEELMPQHTFIDNYLRLQYIDVIAVGNQVIVIPEKKLEFSTKAIKVLEECAKLRPYYTRTWLYFAVYANRIIESNQNLSPEAKEELNQRINSHLEKASQLSPKRPDIFVAWANNKLINEKYQEAKEKAEQCLNFAPKDRECLWAKALALVGLKDFVEAVDYIEKANVEECGETAKQVCGAEAKIAYNQLIKVYLNLIKSGPKPEYYEALANLYQKLIKIEYENFQYHASLAYAYKVLGKYAQAREEAMIVLELSPESRPNVEEFLKSLPD